MLRLHTDSSRFREAINTTAAATGFAPPLVEKDYFCSVILHHIAPRDGVLVFKGGTCLAKIHVGFYRMSEDLDFLIPMPAGASRSERSRRAREVRDLLVRLREPGVRVHRALEGANNSTQYTATVAYASSLRNTEDVIRIEVGLREPLLTPIIQGEARTLLVDPISGSELRSLSVPCLSRAEAIAEKVRAALCRRDVAIRDFYDIDHVVRRLDVRLDDAGLLDLIRRKIAVPGNPPPDVSPERLKDLRSQVESDLRPVLRTRDFAEFDLDRAFTLVARVAAGVTGESPR